MSLYGLLGLYVFNAGARAQRPAWHAHLGEALTPRLVRAVQSQVDALVMAARRLGLYTVDTDGHRLRRYADGEAADMVFEAHLLATFVNANVARLSQPFYQVGCRTPVHVPPLGYDWVTVPPFDVDFQQFAMSKTMDAEVCSDCAAESERGLTDEDLKALGWNLEGEFGSQCPACAPKNVAPGGQTAGVDALADVVGAEKKE